MAQEVVLRPITATNTMAQKVVTTNTDNLQKSTNLIQNAAGYVMDDKHQLEPGDKISFQITEDKKPLINLVVTDSSEVEVPYVGRVSVAKKNCRQLAAELKAMLEKDYYYRATVIVGLDSVNKVRGQIYISGMVRSQGSMDILFNQVLTAGEAILLAGGFSSFADEKMVKVIRHSGNGDSMQKVIEVNMVDVLEKGKIEEDVILEPGDFIIVPAKILNF
jgi:polysaccharide export outer membrane protein